MVLEPTSEITLKEAPPPPPPSAQSAAPCVPKPPAASREEIQAVASKFSDQPVANPEPGVWAVLTAISRSARQRPQGMNILLSNDEHCLGRCMEDICFQIVGAAISASHCKIYREMLDTMHASNNTQRPVFLKDTSTNGTFINWTRLKKNSPPTRLHHGDIIAFPSPPHHDNSFAFVYREVHVVDSQGNGLASLKRRAEDIGAEWKRLKGIGIGSPDGPVSLDDVRSLQRSNTELRQQLESHVLTIEILRNENRASLSRHENELKELKETVSKSFVDQINELQYALDEKEKDTDSLNASILDLKNSVKDLNERLSASKQSRADADEVIHSQKATISKLEVRLDEERNMRREEREKAAADLKSALRKVQAEAQEEFNRQSDIYLRQHSEQQEVINKLQELEKESRLLVETLRAKLEDARENLVMSEKKVRQLELQVQDEQLASANNRKKSGTLEAELGRLNKELENEKVAREEAWAKVSVLELEIAAAIRDLSIEKQRFQGARERIILRETQLRAFYSTTEEISALFAKQQEQLKAMQKTLEDEENYKDALVGSFDLNGLPPRNTSSVISSGKEPNPNNTREAPGASPRIVRATHNCSSDGDDDASTTEKHECGIGTQDTNTQDLECTSADRLAKGFGSDIDAGAGTMAFPKGELTGTERVLETESPLTGDAVADDEQIATLQKCGDLGGETMQVDDDEAQIQENPESTGKLEGGRNGGCSLSRQEDTEPGPIRTADLLASEVAGSWAVCTAPSVNGENESPGSLEHACGDDKGASTSVAVALEELNSQGAGSQSNAADGAVKLTREQRALNAMIEIVAPEFKQNLRAGGEGGKSGYISDAETEEGSGDGEAASDESSDCSQDRAVDGNEAMIQDSVG